jgi:DnaD/phage-associated family protein
LTNPRSTQCGIFEINIKIMEAETGYNRETIEKLIKRFEEYGKILYCRETREIMILNWMKYNFINSRSTICCINKEIKAVKNKEFVNKLYEICLAHGYDTEEIFAGIVIAKEENIKEEEHINEDNQPHDGGLEGATRPLGEEEIKEEIEIKEEAPNKDKIKKKKEEAAPKPNPDKILLEYDEKIRKATINDIYKITLWLKEFEEEVIIQAILEAVKYNAPHIGYLESVIKSWRTLGLFTMDKLKAYREKSSKVNKRPNEDAYEYKD